jgi:arylsulfatase A-like enzyme
MPTLISASWASLGTALLLIGCSPASETEPDAGSLHLNEVVSFQQHQVSTDRISIPEGIGLDDVGYGWLQESAAATGESWLRLTSRIGQVELFSADGDIDQIEVELSGNGSGGPQPPIRIRLNGERLEKVGAPEGWIRLPIEVPADRVHRGLNRLEFAQPTEGPAGASQTASRMRLRRVRVRSSSGRQLWPTRPATISVAEDESETISMPVASSLEAVLALPAAARLQGRFTFEPADRSVREPVYVYVTLLDDSGSQQTLFHDRLYRRVARPQSLRLSLADWAGQQVRVRVGITGRGNGVLRWHGLGISGTESVTLAPPLPPIPIEMPPRSGRLQRPDVMVLLLDAARADAFSPWGGPHPTPGIERLARDGTLFANAISPASWTGQSVPAILTGLFPDTLGIGPWGSRLPPTPPTLAETMANNGYRTVLWSQHPLYSNHLSYRRGFQEFYRTPRGAYDAVPGAEILTAEDRPTFSFVHLIPPHAPYTPPPPFRGSYSGWYQGTMAVDAERLNSYPRRRDPRSVTDPDRRFVLDRYLENAAFADALLGRILDTLTTAGRYDETLIVVLSDHGEAFLEHGNFLHTRTVHREMLHVPFVIKWPRSAELPSSAFGSPVSLVDLVPTLVDGLALDSQGPGFQGISLLPAAIDGRTTERTTYAITRGGHDPQRPPRIQLMLEVDGWRLLCSPDRQSLELYQIETDPMEEEDLASRYPLQTLLLRQAVLSQRHYNASLLSLASATTEEVESLDPKMVEELEALGYLN